MIRKIVFFLIGLGLFAGLQQLIELKTRGFCLQKILADDLLPLSKWETPHLSGEEIDTLFNQPYFFLGAGSECYAFISADGEHVIKFFKLDLWRPVFIHRGLFKEDYSRYAGSVSALPHPLKRLTGMREFRIQRTFQSLKLAYDHLQEETGLIHLHLNPTNYLGRSLTIYDACHIAHEVDLDQTHFFVQKRATPMHEHFRLLKKRGAERQAKASIDSFIEMILTRCQKGYSDRDVLCRNLGFIGTQAIEIDSGSFLPNPAMSSSLAYKRELFYATLELKRWLEKRDPELALYLEKKVAEKIE